MADGPPPQADTVTCHRLNDLAGSIAPVCFDVPPARAPENSIDRLLAMAESSGHLPAVNPNADKGGFKMIMGRAGDTAKNRTKMKGMGINMKDIKSLKKMRKQAVKVGKNAKKESDAAKGQRNAKKGPVRRNGKSDAQEMLATDDRELPPLLWCAVGLTYLQWFGWFSSTRNTTTRLGTPSLRTTCKTRYTVRYLCCACPYGTSD